MRCLIPLLLLVLALPIARAAEEKSVPEYVIRDIAKAPLATEPIRLTPNLLLSMTWDPRQQSATYSLAEHTGGKPLFTFGENSAKQGESYLLRWDANNEVLWFVTPETITRVSLSGGLRKSTTFTRKNSRDVLLPDMPADLASANAELLRSPANP